MENEVTEESGEVFYPGIIDQKTLSACLGTADQIIRGHSERETIERYRRTKAKITAQMRAHPLSFDEWNARAASPLTPEQAKERALKIARQISEIRTAQIGFDAEDEWFDKCSDIIATELAAVVAPVETEWTQDIPTKQGWYWHWYGVDSAVFPLSVLKHGAGTQECFVSLGQAGLSRSVDCSEYGGWWKPMVFPPIPKGESK